MIILRESLLEPTGDAAVENSPRSERASVSAGSADAQTSPARAGSMMAEREDADRGAEDLSPAGAEHETTAAAASRALSRTDSSAATLQAPATPVGERDAREERHARKAAAAIVGAHYGQVYGMLLGLTADSDVAEDLARKTFVQACANPDALNGKGRLIVRLYRIAYREYALRLGAGGDAARTNTIGALADSESLEGLQTIAFSQALNRLTPEHRVVFLLARVQRLSASEIATILGTERETARSRMRTAQRQLRNLLSTTPADARIASSVIALGLACLKARNRSTRGLDRTVSAVKTLSPSGSVQLRRLDFARRLKTTVIAFGSATALAGLLFGYIASAPEISVAPQVLPRDNAFPYFERAVELQNDAQLVDIARESLSKNQISAAIWLLRHRPEPLNSGPNRPQPNLGEAIIRAVRGPQPLASDYTGTVSANGQISGTADPFWSATSSSSSRAPRPDITPWKVKNRASDETFTLSVGFSTRGPELSWTEDPNRAHSAWHPRAYLGGAIDKLLHSADQADLRLHGNLTDPTFESAWSARPSAARDLTLQSEEVKRTFYEALLRENQPALDTLRRGLSRPYAEPRVVDGPRSGDAMTRRRDYLDGVKRLANLLDFEAALHAANGDWAGSVSSALDAVALGEQLPSGSDLGGRLAGQSVEIVARKRIWNAVEHLNARDAREAATRLEAVSAPHVPFSRTIREEKARMLLTVSNTLSQRGGLADRAMLRLLPWLAGNYMRYMDELAETADLPISAGWWAARTPNDSVSNALWFLPGQSRIDDIAGTQTENALLKTALALRAYRLDHRAYPRQLSQLVPGYLQAVPVDPSSEKPTSEPLTFRLDGSRYRLSSSGAHVTVGPQGNIGANPFQVRTREVWQDRSAIGFGGPRVLDGRTNGNR